MHVHLQSFKGLVSSPFVLLERKNPSNVFCSSRQTWLLQIFSHNSPSAGGRWFCNYCFQLGQRTIHKPYIYFLNIYFIEDKDTLSPDDYTNNQLLKDEINAVLQGLTEREEKVLRLRFGLLDGRTRTLEEVGKEFNVTRERIRQIEAKALRKLKNPNRCKRLRDFVK